MKKYFTLLIISQFLACSSTTVIKVSDPSVQIKVNGRVLGSSDVIYSDKKVAWIGTNKVELSKPGCLKKTHKFKRNEKLDTLALISGIFLIIPLAWVMKYQAVHEYEFFCKKKAAY